jgi:hypothetical protein
MSPGFGDIKMVGEISTFGEAHAVQRRVSFFPEWNAIRVELILPRPVAEFISEEMNRNIRNLIERFEFDLFIEEAIPLTVRYQALNELVDPSLDRCADSLAESESIPRREEWLPFPRGRRSQGRPRIPEDPRSLYLESFERRPCDLEGLEQEALSQLITGLHPNDQTFSGAVLSSFSDQEHYGPWQMPELAMMAVSNERADLQELLRRDEIRTDSPARQAHPLQVIRPDSDRFFTVSLRNKVLWRLDVVGSGVAAE